MEQLGGGKSKTRKFYLPRCAVAQMNARTAHVRKHTRHSGEDWPTRKSGSCCTTQESHEKQPCHGVEGSRPAVAASLDASNGGTRSTRRET
jgi:hypothetical protein